MQRFREIKKSLEVFILVILLIVFYFIYMRNALDQFKAGKTTMAQTQMTVSELESPVLIVCPEPPFKPLFLKKYRANHFFWYGPKNRQGFENESSSVIDIYMNMSYQLGSDWSITAILNYR